MEDDKHTYANTYQFVSDKGLSMDELLKLLSGYSPYYCPKLETYARFNADKKTYMEYMDATSYSLLANVTELVYLHAGVYELTLHVDGFAGNEMMDPYDPYDIIMTLYIDTSHAVEYSANLDFIVQGYSVYGDFVTTAY
jgi:hypothetical protein